MKIKRGYKIRNIAGENVIVAIGKLNVNLTKVISLNPTSVWLWEKLGNEEFDAVKVSELLVSNYNVDRDTAIADAEAWLSSRSTAELLEE